MKKNEDDKEQQFTDKPIENQGNKEPDYKEDHKDDQKEDENVDKKDLQKDTAKKNEITYSSGSMLCGLYFCSIPTDQKKHKNRKRIIKKSNPNNNYEQYKASLKKRRARQDEYDRNIQCSSKKERDFEDFPNKQKQLTKESSANSINYTDPKFCTPYFCSIPSAQLSSRNIKDNENNGRSDLNKPDNLVITQAEINNTNNNRSKAGDEQLQDKPERNISNTSDIPNSNRPKAGDEQFQDKQKPGKDRNENVIAKKQSSDNTLSNCNAVFCCCSIPTDRTKIDKKRKCQGDEQYQAQNSKQSDLTKPSRNNIPDTKGDEPYKVKQKQENISSEKPTESKIVKIKPPENDENSVKYKSSIGCFCPPTCCSIPSDYVKTDKKQREQCNVDEQYQVKKSKQHDLIEKPVSNIPVSSKSNPTVQDIEKPTESNKAKEKSQDNDDNNVNKSSTGFFCTPNCCTIPSDYDKTDKKRREPCNVDEQYQAKKSKQHDLIEKPVSNTPVSAKSNPIVQDIEKPTESNRGKGKSQDNDDNNVNKSSTGFFWRPRFCLIPSDYVKPDKKPIERGDRTKLDNSKPPDEITKPLRINSKPNEEDQKHKDSQKEKDDCNYEDPNCTCTYFCSIPADQPDNKKPVKKVQDNKSILSNTSTETDNNKLQKKK